MITQDVKKEEEARERVLLVAITGNDERQALESLDELEELAKTAGATVVGKVMQGKDRPDRATYIGSGKIQEVKALAMAEGAAGIICDDELSPAQMRNLSEALDLKVIDRSMLILDIFAARATTSEGRIQVELAQLKYRLTMLSGLGIAMSRLGGGIGTRGPGEKKLESDRREIRDKIARLRRALQDADEHRQLIRKGQEKRGTKRIALVGYTNAGKSTLMNHLTQAGVLAEDKLFATLDPTTRALVLPDGQEVLLTDTVGFIRKLPHHLIEAFHSTLEEAVYADLILHVVDASSPQMEKQMHVVYETLQDLGAGGKSVITVFNKQDLVSETGAFQGQVIDRRSRCSVKVSARTGEGVEALLASISEVLLDGQILIERLIPYTEGGKLSMIRKSGRILEEEYQGDGIRIKAYVPMDVYGRL